MAISHAAAMTKTAIDIVVSSGTESSRNGSHSAAAERMTKPASVPSTASPRQPVATWTGRSVHSAVCSAAPHASAAANPATLAFAIGVPLAQAMAKNKA